MLVQPTQYIYPPRPTTCLPKEAAEPFLSLGWRPQLKYNDSRTVIKLLPGGKVELWNRHAERFRSYHTPDWLEDQIREAAIILDLPENEYHLLDGGLLDQKHTAIKDTIAIWDILVKNSVHLVGTTYISRHTQLAMELDKEEWIYHHPKTGDTPFGYKITENIFLAKYYNTEDYNTLWETVEKVNAPFTNGKDIKPLLEGVVLKYPNGILQMGYREKNNTDWMAKSRVTTGRHRF